MCAFEMVFSEMESVYNCLKDNSGNLPVYGKLVFFCESLKMFGRFMETTHKRQLDQYFDLLRSQCRNEQLPSLARYRFLEVIELRAMRWEMSDSHVNYYNKKFSNEHEVKGTREVIRSQDKAGNISADCNTTPKMGVFGEREKTPARDDNVGKNAKFQELINSLERFSSRQRSKNKIPCEEYSESGVVPQKTSTKVDKRVSEEVNFDFPGGNSSAQNGTSNYQKSLAKDIIGNLNNCRFEVNSRNKNDTELSCPGSREFKQASNSEVREIAKDFQYLRDQEPIQNYHQERDPAENSNYLNGPEIEERFDLQKVKEILNCNGELEENSKYLEDPEIEANPKNEVPKDGFNFQNGKEIVENKDNFLKDGTSYQTDEYPDDNYFQDMNFPKHSIIKDFTNLSNKATDKIVDLNEHKDSELNESCKKDLFNEPSGSVIDTNEQDKLTDANYNLLEYIDGNVNISNEGVDSLLQKYWIPQESNNFQNQDCITSNYAGYNHNDRPISPQLSIGSTVPILCQESDGNTFTENVNDLPMNYEATLNFQQNNISQVQEDGGNEKNVNQSDKVDVVVNEENKIGHANADSDDSISYSVEDDCDKEDHPGPEKIFPVVPDSQQSEKYQDKDVLDYNKSQADSEVFMHIKNVSKDFLKPIHDNGSNLCEWRRRSVDELEVKSLANTYKIPQRRTLSKGDQETMERPDNESSCDTNSSKCPTQEVNDNEKNSTKDCPSRDDSFHFPDIKLCPISDLSNTTALLKNAVPANNISVEQRPLLAEDIVSTNTVSFEQNTPSDKDMVSMEQGIASAKEIISTVDIASVEHSSILGNENFPVRHITATEQNTRSDKDVSSMDEELSMVSNAISVKEFFFPDDKISTKENILSSGLEIDQADDKLCMEQNTISAKDVILPDKVCRKQNTMSIKEIVFTDDNLFRKPKTLSVRDTISADDEVLMSQSTRSSKEIDLANDNLSTELDTISAKENVKVAIEQSDLPEKQVIHDHLNHKELLTDLYDITEGHLNPSTERPVNNYVYDKIDSKNKNDVMVQENLALEQSPSADRYNSHEYFGKQESLTHHEELFNDPKKQISQSFEPELQEEVKPVMEYRYTLTLGSDVISIIGMNVHLLKMAKITLEERFKGETISDVSHSAPKIELNEGDAFSKSVSDEMKILSPTRILADSGVQCDSEISPNCSGTPEFSSSSTPQSPIFEPAAQENNEYELIPNIESKFTANVQTNQNNFITTGTNAPNRNLMPPAIWKHFSGKSARIRYSREFVVERADHVLSRRTPKNWSTIIRDTSRASLLVKKYGFISALLEAMDEKVDLHIDETKSYLKRNEFYSSPDFYYE